MITDVAGGNNNKAWATDFFDLERNLPSNKQFWEAVDFFVFFYWVLWVLFKGFLGSDFGWACMTIISFRWVLTDGIIMRSSWFRSISKLHSFTLSNFRSFPFLWHEWRFSHKKRIVYIRLQFYILLAANIDTHWHAILLFPFSKGNLIRLIQL